MIPKFRAWNKKTESFIDYGDLMLDLKNAKVYAGDVGIPEYTIDVTKQVVLMQYTGVSDKNGVEIFEGDIVKRTYLFNGGYGETHTGEVVYDEEYARYVISRPQKYIEPKTEDLRNILSDKSTYEIIGNVHENPELMEVHNESKTCTR